MGLKITFWLVFVFVALVTRVAQAAQHVVGGSQGWDQSTDFNSWASKQTFKVGDTLVFKYTSGLHSVVELPNESAYKNCDLGSAIDTKNTGNDIVKLDKSSTRYFSCGTLGHCNQGMKVKIKTAQGGGNTANSSSTSASSTPTASAASASHCFASSISLWLATLFVPSLVKDLVCLYN